MAKPHWMTLHFWMATIGILLYILAIYGAGFLQGVMWRTFNADGILQYEFLQTTNQLLPFYWIRTVGGSLYLGAAILGGVNILLTWRKRPKKYVVPEYEAAPLMRRWKPQPIPGSTLPAGSVIQLGHRLNVFSALRWHRRLEGLPLTFTIWVVVTVAVASLFQIIPMFAIKSDIPRIASVRPYTPLELVGRDIYISEGCVNCHSQMVRPLVAETERYGEYSKPGESVYDHPFLWGSRRIGPDLAREGVRNPSALWHLRHFAAPDSTSPGSIMPAYGHLLDQPIDWDQAERAVRAMHSLGVYYDAAALDSAPTLAREQAKKIQAQLVQENGSPDGVSNMEDRKVMAIIAYLQRLGVDLNAPIEVVVPAAGPVAANTHEPSEATR
jgi:cytochrome c oxidase cbb3-type subunit I/II